MPAIGILEGEDNALWFSSSEIKRYMALIKHAISFASNIKDGRLDEISHTPFMLHGQKVEHPEQHAMEVRTITIPGKEGDQQLHFCLDYSTGELPGRYLAKQLLELFTEKFLEKFKPKPKTILRLKKNPDECTSTCDQIFNEVMVGYELFSADEAEFLLDGQEENRNFLRLLFAAVAAQGLPVAAKFYEDVASQFHVNVSEGENVNMVLQNLIPAQLSTLLFQSITSGTSVNYLRIRFTDLEAMAEKEMSVNFFPINHLEEERLIMGNDDFAFIMMSEGDPSLAVMFQRGVSPLLSSTGLFTSKFDGNPGKYAHVAELMSRFPRNLEIEE